MEHPATRITQQWIDAVIEDEAVKTAEAALDSISPLEKEDWEDWEKMSGHYFNGTIQEVLPTEADFRELEVMFERIFSREPTEEEKRQFESTYWETIQNLAQEALGDD